MDRTAKLIVATLSAGLFLSYPTSSSWAGSDAKLIEGAKSEGAVSFYTTMTLSQSKKVVDRFNPMMLAAKAPHPNAGKLFINFLLSKEGQKMLVSFRRIPVRNDVDADPPRLFKGYKRVVENPEDYKNFSATVKLYQKIFGLR